MRLKEVLLSTVFMSFALVTTEAMPPLDFFDETAHESGNLVRESTGAKAPVAPAPSTLIAGDKVLGSAFYDTLNILSTNNNCSEFFGGAGEAVDIFTRLIARASKGYWPTAVGIRMSGPTTTVVNSRTKKQYRLFDKVLINTNGPFYRKRVSNAESAVPRIGTFEPNTKEARVLMLLHELGHVVKGSDGAWLLPNDGSSDVVSQNNSEKIEQVCGDEIKGLRKATGSADLPELDRSVQTSEQRIDPEFSNR